MEVQDWLVGFIQSLEEASDFTRQWEAWVERSDPNLPSPIELVCQAFDDSGVDDLLSEGLVFSDATDDRLRRLSALATELDLKVPPETLLSSNGWGEFVREAKVALASVKRDVLKENQVQD